MRRSDIGDRYDDYYGRDDKKYGGGYNKRDDCDACNDKYQADGDRRRGCRCGDDRRCHCRYDREPTLPPFPIPAVNMGSSSYSGATVAAVVPSGGIVTMGATSNITTGSGVQVNPNGGLQFTVVTPGRYIVYAKTPVIAGAAGGQLTLSVNGVPQPLFSTVVPPGPGASEAIVTGVVVATTGTTVSLINYGSSPLTIPTTVDGVQAYSGITFIRLSD